MMWIRICLLLTVALTLVNATGTYRLVHPALVPGWLDRFPNSRILLNRDYYNYLYRRLILRDPYWRSRIHLHRHIYPGVIRSQRIINPILLRRNVRVLAPQVQTSVVNFPPPIPQDHRHLIGKAETFVRYTSPTIDTYNTPWQKISSSYRDYGEATAPALYDRPFYGGNSAAVLPSVYDNEEIYAGFPAPAAAAASGFYDDQIGATGAFDLQSQQSLSVLPGAIAPVPEGPNPHLIGKGETFVRYTSPHIERYNTPWTKTGHQYQDYGEVDSDYGYGLQESAYLGGGDLGEGGFGGFSANLGLGGASLGLSGERFASNVFHKS